ncbi:hypothetical protein K1X84_11940 [bacterium]|nr:hypothetical protein [bacterium]
MIHTIGYIALILNLFSMTKSNPMSLRIFSFLANAIYVIYGIFLNAPPIFIGCGIAVVIHLFHIIKLRKTKAV